jgi:hypothetical protein
MQWLVLKFVQKKYIRMVVRFFNRNLHRPEPPGRAEFFLDDAAGVVAT